MTRSGSIFRSGVAALAAAAMLAAVVASPAAAAPENGGLEKLWEEFPLDAERESPAARAPGDVPPARVEPQKQPAAAAQTVDARASSWPATQIGLTAAGIALGVAAVAVAVAYAGRAPRRRHLRVRTSPLVRPLRLRPQPAATPAGPPMDRDVVDGLLRAVSAASARTTRETQGSLRAANREARGSNLPTASKKAIVESKSEAEVLPRKPLVDAAGALTGKDGQGVRVKQQLAATDTAMLKAKLMAKPEEKRAAAPVDGPTGSAPRPGKLAGRRSRR